MSLLFRLATIKDQWRNRHFLGANAQGLFPGIQGRIQGGRGGLFCSLLDFGRKSGHLRDVMTFFLLFDFERKTDVMIFNEPVLFLHSENIIWPFWHGFKFRPPVCRVQNFYWGECFCLQFCLNSEPK